MKLSLIGGVIALVTLVLFIYIFLNSKEVQVESLGQTAVSKVKKDNFSKDLVLLKDEIFGLRNNLSLIEKKISLLDKKAALEKQNLFQSLRLLRQDISKLKQQLGEKNSSSFVGFEQDRDLSSANSETTEQTLLDETRKSDLKIKEQWDKLSDDFQLESTDAQWSMNATQGITDGFGKIPDIDAQISQIDCRTSQCFVEANLKSQSDVNKLTLIFPMKVSGFFSNINYNYTSHEDGSVTVSMYLGKSK